MARGELLIGYEDISGVIKEKVKELYQTFNSSATLTNKGQDFCS